MMDVAEKTANLLKQEARNDDLIVVKALNMYVAECTKVLKTLNGEENISPHCYPIR